MFFLDNEVRRYAWGSHRVIAELTNRPCPTGEPEAELWLGAHPAASSRARDLPGSPALCDLIQADPEHHLGRVLDGEYHGRLPFLFKVLAAETPLSIQAHPTAARARAGFAEENERGIPLDSPERNYRDPFAKPELFVAVSECEVLCGFREAQDSAGLLARLGIRILAPYVGSLLTGQPADGLRVAVTTLLSMPKDKQHELAGRVVEESGRMVGRLDDDDPDRLPYEWAIRLGEAYPGDIGVVISLLLNLITLQPWQGVYLGPGQLHAYLHGWGLEAQSNSDNTLRGGLTPKHIDVAELLRIIDFEPGPLPVIEPEVLGPEAGVDEGMTTWPTPAREFALYRREIKNEEVTVSAEGPQILFCIDGMIKMRCSDLVCELSKGESVFVTAAQGTVAVSGEGTFTRVSAGRVIRSR